MSCVFDFEIFQKVAELRITCTTSAAKQGQMAAFNQVSEGEVNATKEFPISSFGGGISMTTGGIISGR